MNSSSKNDKPTVNTDVHHPNPSKIEYYIEYIFDKFSQGIRLIGPLFAFALTVFISIVTHAFFHVILPYYVRQFGLVFGLLLIVIALYVLFNLLFNYFMAVLVKPGSMSDFKTSKYYRKHDPLTINPEIIDLQTVFNNSINKSPDKIPAPQNNVFQFKMKKNFTINSEETLINMNNAVKEDTTDSNKLDNKYNQEGNPITEDSIDEMMKNLDEKSGCIPKINENDLLNNNFNENEINLLNLNNNIDIIGKKEENIENNLVDSQNDKINEENAINNNIYNTDNLTNVTSITFSPRVNKCKYCKEQKVLRSHHCQVCGICIFKMDHHCPWINNCVGHFNHRYFVLFLTWLMFGCIFVSIFSIPILFTTKLKKSNEFNFISVLCLVGMILMSFFNTWNWFLVFRGNTTIEFWSLKSGFKTESKIKDFSLPKWRDNIFLVFGTRSMFQAIFCASKRRLPVSGIEWTKLALPQQTFSLRKPMYMQELS